MSYQRRVGFEQSGVLLTEGIARNIESPAALVLCGGGSRGALEVGFYRAVRELGLPVDFVIGSSIGALNGAYIAAGMSPDELTRLWLTFRRREAIRLNLRWLLEPWRRPGLFQLDFLREWLRRTLPVTRFEQLPIPLTIATTDLQLGKAVHWHGAGDIIEPLMATVSLPGLFPPVEIDAHQFVDGGIANNVPLDQALALGAAHILMIQCVCCDPFVKPLRGLIDVVARSFSVALDCKYAVDLERFSLAVQIHVVRPHFQRDVGLLDFRYSADLIETAYKQTLEQFQ